ncbi:arsenite efflux MFS transporter ArsK (plasmid) [Phyllobacterium sp. A18/5-2]|uniref:arsenite efflux MFS transporter ArsK n=1 Tax=Phyllobacterium sp. A18/5-2 TaxID=2978392 RepID=UPI0021C806F0|nr:arsenite efflux MFS transporter ArsK [Phyllobacterium sp. A18/5-2]UXN66126.1 arsenite efflux MFS transporter ArsK [Phyllobacterium sp. A18/5-2]
MGTSRNAPLFTQSHLIVAALGVTQIIGYGTLYYSFSPLAASMGQEFGWPSDWVFGAFSASLLAGGLASPWVGRWIDRFGAGQVMALGSIGAAIALLACALATNAIAFVIGLVAIELASTFVLYNAAFALLVQIKPTTAKTSITHLTLIAGFASTIFWPVTTALHEHLTWREVYYVFGAAHLLLCLPIHIWLARLSSNGHQFSMKAATPVVEDMLPIERLRMGFVLMVSGFALLGFINAAILIHMLPILAALGLGSASVLVGTLFGPAQVASRLFSLMSGNRLQPLSLAIISTGLMSSAIAILLWSGSWQTGALAFAVIFGLGSGLSSIAQGTLPLALFGSVGYGERVGQSTAVRLVASSGAPFVFAFIMHWLGIGPSLLICVAVGCLAAASFALIGRQLRVSINEEAAGASSGRWR